tara:strand:- start:7755 stop:7997 length:243 start_codon:yes stop_codon:yes gene_type:complete
MEVMTFAKQFCDILQANGKLLPASEDIRAHIDEIWMQDVLEFCAESNYTVVDIDINLSQGKDNNPLVVALYKLEPKYTQL